MEALESLPNDAGSRRDERLAKAIARGLSARKRMAIVKTSGQRQSINVIIAVNARGAFWAATYDGILNAESFAQFLQNFMKGRSGNVFLVLDGHPAHNAKRVKDCVGSLQMRLVLHRLPTYSPDLNPDEFVWSHMKTNGVSKNESLRGSEDEDLLKIGNDQKLVRSFFGANSVAYANA